MRFPIRPFEKVPHLPFMRWRRFWIWSSVAMVLAVFVLLGMRGRNYGIGVVGGKLVEGQTTHAVDVADVRAAVLEAGFEGVTIQQYGGGNDFIIRLPGSEEKARTAQAEADIVSALTARVG